MYAAVKNCVGKKRILQLYVAGIRRAPPCKLVRAMEPQFFSRRLNKDLMLFKNRIIYDGNEQSNQDHSLYRHGSALGDMK
jgi:hypothetical protein